MREGKLSAVVCDAKGSPLCLDLLPGAVIKSNDLGGELFKIFVVNRESKVVLNSK